MSRTMITDGEPLPALLDPVRRQAEPDNRVEGGPLVLGDGLGFLPRGLVDQHFDARRRLGRLARALFELAPPQRIGFGIDEDTALIVDLASGAATVEGRSVVTLLDARSARRLPGPRFGADNLLLGFASRDDRIDLATLALVPAPGRKPIARRQAPRSVPAGSGGMAVPEPPVEQMLADALFATPGLDRLERPSLRGTEGVSFQFRKDGSSMGLVGGGTSLSGILFAIRPLALTITETAR